MAKWAQLEAGYYRHPKTLRLKRSIGSDAYWVPPRLWCYCLERESDDISGLSPDDLKDLLEFGGDAAALIDALKTCGFVSPDGKVIGWEERYGAKLKFYRERAKIGAAARWRLPKPSEEGSTEKTKTETETKTETKTRKHAEACRSMLEGCFKHPRSRFLPQR